MSRESQTSKIYSVQELTEEIQNLLEDRFDFVWVEGEISNFSAPVSGHYYMVLKDEKAQIRAVMFRLQARYLRFLPEDGMKVIAQGRIGVYPPRGEYQIILDYLEPMGVGALALAFEQLKKKLAAHGIFDEEIKRPLPFLPQRVAVITSPTGAAFRDFLKIVRRKFANIEIILVPVRVQGREAATDMVKALELVNRELEVDVILLTRGGGSLEDLWAFNEEDLALAIRRSGIPVVSAVGHEVDLTISDLVADLRAPTPSAAAELLVGEKESLINRVNEIRDRLISGIGVSLKNHDRELGILGRGLKDPRKRLADTWLRLDEIHTRLVRVMEIIFREWKKRVSTEGRALLLHSPTGMISSMRQRVEFQKISLRQGMKSQLGQKQTILSLLEKGVQDLSPLSILRRGYSITRRLPEGDVVRDTSVVREGDHVQVLLSEGELECKIEKVEEKKVLGHLAPQS